MHIAQITFKISLFLNNNLFKIRQYNNTYTCNSAERGRTIRKYMLLYLFKLKERFLGIGAYAGDKLFCPQPNATEYQGPCYSFYCVRFLSIVEG